MALVGFTGFELGDSSEIFALSGTASIQGSTLRTGSYALRCNPTTTGTGYGQVVTKATTGAFTNGNTATSYISFYFRFATAPGSNNEEMLDILDTSTVFSKASLRLNSDGTISLYDLNPTLVATSSTALSANTWYLVELKIGTGSNGACDYELKIDGASEFSASTGSFRTSNAARWSFGKVTNRNSQSIDFFYDDIWIDDAAYKGSIEVKVKKPVGNGNYTAWSLGTTGTYTDVDDLPHDSDTTYIESATSGQAETVTLESNATVGITGTIHAVQSGATWREQPSGTSSIQTRLRSATTDNDTVALNGGTGYSYRAKMYETDPATSSAWVLSALDSIEVGIVNGANVNVRCTQLTAMVAYTPSGGGGGTTGNLLLRGKGLNRMRLIA